MLALAAVTFLPGLTRCEGSCFNYDEQGNRYYFECVTCVERDQEPCTVDSWQVPMGGVCDVSQQPVLEDGELCQLDGELGVCANTVCGSLPARSVILNASPKTVGANQTSTLSWTSKDMTSCTASGAWTGPKPVEGSVSTGALDGTSTFTLQCSGPTGSASDSVTVTVAPAGGQLSFTQMTIEASQAAWGKNLADIDGDGFLDILEGGGVQGGKVFWYEYPSWAKFQIGAIGGGDDIEVADINADGAIDVVVNGNPIIWYANPRGSGGNPRSQWTGHTIDTTISHDVNVADIDRDGKLDVVAVQEYGASFLYLQNGADSWSKTTLSNARVTAGGLTLADVDADGRIDVIGSGYWLRQPATPSAGSNWERHNIAVWGAGGSIDTADLNHDGRLDIVMAASESGPGEIAWFEGPVDPLNGSWIEHTIDEVEDVHLVHLADFDKDGDLDIAFAEMHQSPTDRVGIYVNGGLGASWTLDLIASTGSHNIAVGDLEDDGDIDIVGANWQLSSPDGGRLNWWRNDIDSSAALSLSQWTPISVDASKPDQSFGLAFGDIDGDARLDILTGRGWYRSPGGNLTGNWTRTDFGQDVDAMLLLDVDGDVRLDIIAEGAPSGGNVPVLWLRPLNSAGSQWATTTVGTIPRDPADGRSQGFELAQIVPGGRPEIVLSSVGLYYFEIPASPAGGNWPRVQITSQAREEGLAVGDIDRDGDPDVAGFVAPAGTTVAWWENPRDGSSNWTRHDLGTTSGVEPDRIRLADMNRNGRLDVVVTETNLGANGNALFWFAQPSDPTAPNWSRKTVASNEGSLNSLDVADLNGDAKPDIITGEHRGALDVTIWENLDGASSWVSHGVSQGAESHLGTQLVDLDGDGDLDVVSIAWDDFQNLWLLRNDAL